MNTLSWFHIHRYGGYLIAGLRRRFIHLNDVSYCYYDRPSTPSNTKREETILFIHGYTNSKDTWIMVAKHLPKEWRILALDLPGHGESGFKPKSDHSPEGIVRKVHEVGSSPCCFIHNSASHHVESTFSSLMTQFVIEYMGWVLVWEHMYFDCTSSMSFHQPGPHYFLTLANYIISTKDELMGAWT